MVRKQAWNTSGSAAVVATGVIMCLVMAVLCIAVCAALISVDTINTKDADYWVMGILLVSSLCGGTVIAGKGKEILVVKAIIAAIGYIVVLLLMTAILFNGHYGEIWLRSIVVIIGYLLPVIVKNYRLGIRRNHKNKKRGRYFVQIALTGK